MSCANQRRKAEATVMPKTIPMRAPATARRGAAALNDMGVFSNSLVCSTREWTTGREIQNPVAVVLPRPLIRREHQDALIAGESEKHDWVDVDDRGRVRA